MPIEPGVFNILNDNLILLMLKRVIGGEYVKKWCHLPYQGNPNGCPQCERCDKFPLWSTIIDPPYYFVIRTFDLSAHAKKMKEKFPTWTEKQCRNSRLWQSHQDKLLKDDTEYIVVHTPNNNIFMLRPEMYGVNIFSTCRIHGLLIPKNPTDVVYRIAMVGKAKEENLQEWFK
jgi:hypothetical protein